MNGFIEIPILLQKNDPDDETDYEDLGIASPDYPIEEEVCLLNTRDIQRVNLSGQGPGVTVLWMFDGGAYHTTLEYEQVKKKIYESQ